MGGNGAKGKKGGSSEKKKDAIGSWFKESPNFSKEDALRLYNNDIKTGFDEQHARQTVLGQQKITESKVYSGKKRDVTSSTYINAQKKLNKKVKDFLGKGLA